jgi:hypothetical protein
VTQDAQNPGMLDERLEQAGLGRNRQLEHHALTVGYGVDRGQNLVRQDALGGAALGAPDTHFNLDDRHAAAASSCRATSNCWRTTATIPSVEPSSGTQIELLAIGPISKGSASAHLAFGER